MLDAGSLMLVSNLALISSIKNPESSIIIPCTMTRSGYFCTCLRAEMPHYGMQAWQNKF